jgi:hypothetical protein
MVTLLLIIQIKTKIGGDEHMNYIIADPDEKSATKLKEILDFHDMLVFQEKFTTLEATRIVFAVNPPNLPLLGLGRLN